jgi:hypothetical protein
MIEVRSEGGKSVSRLKHTPMLPALHRRIWEGWPPILAGEAMQQCRIRPESLCTSMKLPRIAQQNLRTTAKRAHNAANLNILFPILTQIADSLPVRIRAHHGKPTLLIRRLRTANIQKASPIGQFNNVINMRSYANIFVLMRKHVLW